MTALIALSESRVPEQAARTWSWVSWCSTVKRLVLVR